MYLDGRYSLLDLYWNWILFGFISSALILVIWSIEKFKFYQNIINGKSATQILRKWASKPLAPWPCSGRRIWRSRKRLNNIKDVVGQACIKWSHGQRLEIVNNANRRHLISLNTSPALKIWIHQSRNVRFEWNTSRIFLIIKIVFENLSYVLKGEI